MARDLRTSIEEKIAELRQADHVKELRDLMQFRAGVVRGIDRRLDNLRDQKTLVQEALRKRLQFQKYRISVFHLSRHMTLRKILSLPFIYSMIVPAVILHVFLEVYHHVGFRLYSIPLVPMQEYFIFDRGHLAYLNWFEKMNCMYCSYFGGLIGYAREIAARTERYWCPIKYARRLSREHSQYSTFVEYLDGQNYHKNLSEIRKFKELRKK